MSKHEGRRLDRHTAEQLLRGAPADVPGALAGLLAAAAAPPRDGELGGEPAAVAAFLEAARHTHAPRPGSPSMRKSTWAKLLTAKVAAAAAAIFAAGGVATAAVTGALPLPAGDPPRAPATSAPSDPAAGEPATSTTAHTRDETRPAPAPSLPGLCRAYEAGDQAERGKAPANPAFTALVTAAGGQAGVDGYCAALLGAEAPTPVRTTGAPAVPGRSDNGKEHSTGSHPSGPPATHPSGPPNTRPTH
ncbi:hypothetical protein [Amycolatopsis australiensis]|uniref:Uncharacterized protein n=1 Tax=Amycolatopsis australiensis TaxID=546364 RepID=A0A1K1RU07_9PSEU|nr:hypothetical protein [Amycolatopsis australiensis]SFW75301.1 hypothetical protein SAMN04489730_3916 [Amycolatopsis australiensis]